MDNVPAVIAKHFTQWMQEGIRSEGSIQQCRRLMLANGVSLSIQAGEYAYCYPREALPYSQYLEFEVGFPSTEIEALMPYCEDSENPTGTVYPYVPLEVLDQYMTTNPVVGYA